MSKRKNPFFLVSFAFCISDQKYVHYRDIVIKVESSKVETKT